MSQAAPAMRSKLFDLVDVTNISSGSPAVGSESERIAKERKRSLEHYLLPSTTQFKFPELRFSRLKQEWEKDTAPLSSITAISMHPAYQQIIGMGYVAIPFILSEMEKKPNHWFWALKSITGEDPILLSQRGRIKKMTEAWLLWGKQKGYLN